MKLSEIIANYRKVHRISMDDLSEKSGISKAYIAILENDKNPGTGRPVKPSLDTLQKLAAAMNMSTDQLVASLDDNTPIAIQPEKDPEPEMPQFKTTADAVKFLLDQKVVAAFGGYDIEKLTDEQKIQFAKEIQEMIRMLSAHYKQ